eukprot:jgi/Undpi1/5454/HiC_scaffold_2.g00733.m1
MRRLHSSTPFGASTLSTAQNSLRGGGTIDMNSRESLLKGGALTTLVLQNSALALVMRYTRVSGLPSSMYISTTAVVMAEIFKLTVALVVQLQIEGSVGALVKNVHANTIGQPEQYLKMGVLALLYTLQNNLAYVAASHLDGPTYQIICQSKILITALLSVVILGKSLFRRQWTSLGALTLGVALVQVSGSESGEEDTSNSLIGLVSAISLCFCSGLGGVFFELMLKGNSSASLWIRNIQLGSFSLFLGLLAVVFKDGAAVSSRGFFSGYSPMVWLCISLHSLGGLAVAMVVKYADNVVKCFATSISIVLSCVLSIAFLGMSLSQGFVFGTILVMCATYMYNTKPVEQKMLGASEGLLSEAVDKVDGRSTPEPKDNV